MNILRILALGLAGGFAAAASAAEPAAPHELLGSWTNGRGAVYTFRANETVEVRVKDRRIHGQYLFSRGTVAIYYPEYGLMEVAQLSRLGDVRSQLRSTILVTSVPGSKAGDEHLLARWMERVPEGE